MTNSNDIAEHFDVLIIGAGISGIGAGCHLKSKLPSKTFAVLEGRSASGGTWDLFRYPGIRSDSDLHTFGYEFEPWRDKNSIADASAILAYLRDTAQRHGVEDHIRYEHKVVSVDWSSGRGRWILDVDRGAGGERVRLSATWIFAATGYYRYDEGYTPRFAGRDRFDGQIVHPQHWPEDLDYTGKKVVVIGSGATAVTLVPAMAERVEHITMLQRTPTYVMPVPRQDAIANLLPKLLGEKRGYAWARRKNIEQQRAIWKFCQRFPRGARRLIRALNVRQLPDGYPVDVHFNPPYDPWTQRLCAVPDGDLFKAIGAGKASVVTDRIATFTPKGVLLESGRELHADIVVTATGLNLQMLGGMTVSLDGEAVSLSDSVIYRGMMLSGVPNLALSIGYTNSSWTLKVGLLCEYFCKLLDHMDSAGVTVAHVHAEADMQTRPLLDFNAGYVLRSLEALPKQGPAAPWLMSLNYQADCKLLRDGDVTDSHLRFANAPSEESNATALATSTVNA